MTKPPDAPTVQRPVWALALHPVTLGIDDVRISPWSEVADETLAVLIPWSPWPAQTMSLFPDPLAWRTTPPSASRTEAGW